MNFLSLTKLPKYQIVTFLLICPFGLTGIERYLIKPLTLLFSLPDTSAYFLRISTISILLLAFAAFLGETYGLEITKKLKQQIAGMFITFIVICYFFLFSLKVKELSDDLVVIHLANWIITVFREEFLLRGMIQTQASYVTEGKFLQISYPIWISTAAFSIWHLVNLAYWPWHVVILQMLACMPTGIIFGLIKEKTGNTLLTYLLHISGDLLFLSVYALLFGRLFASLF